MRNQIKYKKKFIKNKPTIIFKDLTNIRLVYDNNGKAWYLYFVANNNLFNSLFALINDGFRVWQCMREKNGYAIYFEKESDAIRYVSNNFGYWGKDMRETDSEYLHRILSIPMDNLDEDDLRFIISNDKISEEIKESYKQEFERLINNKNEK